MLLLSKKPSIAAVVRKLEEHDALKHTILVTAAHQIPAIQYIAHIQDTQVNILETQAKML